MEAELAKSIVADERLEKTPEEDKYGQYDNRRDYVANGQIMVTITLTEYRELLVKNVAEKLNDANSKRYAAERERDELKKQVADLQKQLSDLRGMIASAVPVKVSVDTGDE